LAESVSLKHLEWAWEEADRLNLLQLNAIQRVCERGYGRRALKPIPSFNTSVLGFEVDALWPAQHLSAELDSWEFHRHRAAFENDRARDAALQAAGYRTIRITHRRLTTEPTKLLTQLRATPAKFFAIPARTSERSRVGVKRLVLFGQEAGGDSRSVSIQKVKRNPYPGPLRA
jgi:hypothetical protein